MTTCLLVVAKAPVPGLAKTRLMPAATPDQAAAVAAAALLDTLDAVLATPGAVPVVAMTGDLHEAARSREIAAALSCCTVFPQRGDGFADRLAAAHRDVADRFPGLPVLQIGMDTPQVTADLLAESAGALHAGASLGPALDGGWWALGLRDPRDADALRGVPMSRPDTGERTVSALQELGLTVGLLPALSDVDTMDDAVEVAGAVPGSRFAAAVAAIGHRSPAGVRR